MEYQKIKNLLDTMIDEIPRRNFERRKNFYTPSF